MKLASIVALLITNYVVLEVVEADERHRNYSEDIRKKLVTSNSIHENFNAFQGPSSADALSPVILLPGDGGSMLQAKLNRADVLHQYCARKSNDWFDLWLNLSLLVPFALDCWVDK